MDMAIDREVLEGLATRAKNKSVNRRARTMLQALDDAETARREALERHQQRADLHARPESKRSRRLAADEDTARKLGEAEAEWRALNEAARIEASSDENARDSRRRPRPCTRHWIAAADRAHAARLALAETARGRARLEGLACASAWTRCTARTLLDELAAGARRMGRAADADPIRIRPTPSCSHDSRPPVAARPRGTRTGRRSSA